MDKLNSVFRMVVKSRVNLRYLIFIPALLLAGCSTLQQPPLSYIPIPYMHFVGAKPDTMSAEDTLTIGLRTYDVTNLAERERKNFKAAASKVETVMASEEFRDDISKLTLLSGCQGPEVSGDEILNALNQKTNRISVLARSSWLANATADPVNNRVTLGPRRLNGWKDNPGAIVNTIAHEITHYVRTSSGVIFTDGGHGTNLCPDHRLVSYRIGCLAEFHTTGASSGLGCPKG